MFDPVERENKVIEILDEFSQKNMDFVVIGGYAVSAFRHRFSIDADIIIRKNDVIVFEATLRKEGYVKTKSRKLENTYSSEFVRFENKKHSVSVDMLIDAVESRQTGAVFSFDFLRKNSSKKEIKGIEKRVIANVPKREVLIIMKLHSGRLTDMRDVASLCFGIDMGFVKENLFRGEKSVIKGNMKKLKALVQDRGFQNSFKGVFREKMYKIYPDEINKLVGLSE